MEDRQVIVVRLFVLLLAVILGIIVWVIDLHVTQNVDNRLQISFLDIGQGDATLIETADGLQVLIDGGPDTSVLRALGSELSFFDRTIDMVVVTHFDSDHIAGLVDVLTRYEVATIVMTENYDDTPDGVALAAAIANERAEVVYARAGQMWQLDASTTLSVLWPIQNPEGMEKNASSIVLQLSHDEVDVLLTGDAPKRIETFLVDTYGDTLQSEILKVGHHGSKTSTTEQFVALVAPQYAVTSAGHDNRYGHPHTEVTDVLAAYDIPHLVTGDMGTVTFLSDGRNVYRDTK